jgi:hypothetical protein
MGLSSISFARHDGRTPKDAEIFRTLQFLAEERSSEDAMLYSGLQLESIGSVGQNFTHLLRLLAASVVLCETRTCAERVHHIELELYFCR